MSLKTGKNGTADQRDLFLEYAVRLTKNRLQAVDMLRSILLLGGFIFGYVALFVVLDHLLTGGLPPTAARLMLAGFVLGSAWIVGRYMIAPLIRRINDLYAARLIERANPQIKNSLIATMQFRDHGDLPPEVLAAIKDKAVEGVGQVDVAAAVNSNHLVRPIVALAVLLVGLVLFSLTSSKSAFTSIRRAIGDWDRPAPTATRIAEVFVRGDELDIVPARNPDKRFYVLQDESPVFGAATEGKHPQEVKIRISRDGGKTFPPDDRLTLGPAGFDVYSRPTWTRRLQVTQTLLFQVEAGDALSSLYTVEALPPPRADVYLSADFPPYTRQPPLVRDRRTSLVAVEGTRLTVIAETNVPPGDAGASIEFNDARAAIRMGPASADRRTWKHDMLLSARDDFVFVVRFADRFGHQNKDPISYHVRVRPDNPPLMELLSAPTVLQPNEPLRLRGQASDDFGLSRAVLRWRRHDQPEFQELELFSGANGAATPRLDLRRDFDVARQFNLLPGAPPMHWQVVVTDNRQPDGQPTGGDRMYQLQVAPPPQEGQGASPQSNPTAQPQADNQQGDSSQNDSGQQPQNGQDTIRSEQPQSNRQGDSGQTGEVNQPGGAQGGAGDDPLRDVPADDRRKLDKLAEHVSDQPPDRQDNQQGGNQSNQQTGDSQNGQGPAQRQVEGQGQGPGQGQAQGPGQGPGQGQGEGQGEGQGQAQDQGNGQERGQGQGQPGDQGQGGVPNSPAPPTDGGSSGGAGPSPAGGVLPGVQTDGGAMIGQPPDRRREVDDQPLGPQGAGRSKLESLGKAVDSAAEQVRKNEPTDPALLKQLDMTQSEFSGFVRKYKDFFDRRREQQARPDLIARPVPLDARPEIAGPLQTGRGVGEGIGGIDIRPQINVDRERQLRQAHREDLSDELRQVYEDYNKVINTTQPD